MTSEKRLRLDDQLCFALYSATNAITRAYRPLLAAIGLTYPQYLAMITLWERGESTVNEIAGTLGLAGHVVTPLLQRLESAGLLTRTRDDVDRRVVRVRLTPAGRRLESRASRAQAEVADRTELCPGELTALRSQLQQLAAGLEAAHPRRLDAG